MKDTQLTVTGLLWEGCVGTLVNRRDSFRTNTETPIVYSKAETTADHPAFITTYIGKVKYFVRLTVASQNFVHVE